MHFMYVQFLEHQPILNQKWFAPKGLLPANLDSEYSEYTPTNLTRYHQSGFRFNVETLKNCSKAAVHFSNESYWKHFERRRSCPKRNWWKFDLFFSSVLPISLSVCPTCRCGPGQRTESKSSRPVCPPRAHIFPASFFPLPPRTPLLDLPLFLLLLFTLLHNVSARSPSPSRSPFPFRLSFMIFSLPV